MGCQPCAFPSGRNTSKSGIPHNTRTALSRAQASEEKYRLISQVSSDYTFATEVHKDGSASLNWVAGAFEKMTGYTYEEYVANGGWLAHIHPDDLEKDAQDMEKLHKNQDIINRKSEHLQKMVKFAGSIFLRTRLEMKKRIALCESSARCRM